MTVLSHSAVIGILGGGQLGRLLALAAGRMGFDVHIYCPDEAAPAFRVAAKSWCYAYDDVSALKAFAAACDVITYEFENVPVSTVRQLEAAGGRVHPGAEALQQGQDRLTEKTFLNEIGIETTPFKPIETMSDIAPALESLGGKAILKHRREGYDGKGQARIAGPGDIDAAAHLCAAPCILEAWAPFEREISVILARSISGEIAVYDPPENIHAEGILRKSQVPAAISSETRAAAQSATTTLAEALDYVGTLALEFFVMADGRLLANEFAPRVHNSGHWTPEACATGQFEQHIRAISGWPLGDTQRVFDAEMINLLGDDIHTLGRELDGHTSAVFYGKATPRPGRKMGHLTRRTGRALST